VLGYIKCLVLGNIYIELVSIHGVRIHLVSSVRKHLIELVLVLLVLGYN